jgi:hypothetical protein
MSNSEPTSSAAKTEIKERQFSVRFFVSSLIVVLGLFLGICLPSKAPSVRLEQIGV